ncbi:MAG: DNA replication/repair protein RecF [Clostridia bacterium]|nr:DNA replication/repair protein RecF [Clostridia bacterium]
MLIKEVYLENFRNYDKQKIELNDHVNVFYGKNAQGKTNILEALYFCSLGRSFRTHREQELIQFENEHSKIVVKYFKNNRDSEIEIALHKNERKSIKLNKIKLNKNSELVGNINLVLFSPDDIIMLKEGPAQRRKFLDILISQLKIKYLYELNEYNKVLEQRNAMLKSKRIDGIEVWNEQLATKCEKISAYRKEYVDKLQEQLTTIHPKLTNELETIRIQYKSNFKNKEQFLNLLEQKQELDLLRGYTSEGIHRDDFEILINEVPLNAYGSQGQHKTAILSLKMSELMIVKDEIGENPILLLDDVTSELDTSRISSIFENIQDYQVLITCTDVNSILKYDSLTKNIKLYNIDRGAIQNKGE